MDALNYKRTEVLAKLKTNRDNHKKAYDDAMEGFKEAVINELTEVLELAKSGKEYRLYLKQTLPKNYLKEYDRAIAMLAMSSQDEIKLQEGEFTQYVLDNWAWTENFVTSARTYGKGLY